MHGQGSSHMALLGAALREMRRRRPSGPGRRVSQPCQLACAAPQPQAQVQPTGGRVCMCCTAVTPQA